MKKKSWKEKFKEAAEPVVPTFAEGVKPCALRGNHPVGIKPCTTCGDRKVKWKLFECVRRNEPVTVPDCQECETVAEPIQAPPALSLDLYLSTRCNLRCKFCYITDSNTPMIGPDINRTMQTIAWFLEQNAGVDKSRKRQITFYGGEPLFEWEDLQKTVIETRRIWPSIKVDFSIVTNCTLLTEDKIDWILKNGVGIQVSIDGLPEAQDTFRVDAAGKGSSGVVFENAVQLLKRKPNLNVRSTIAPETVHLLYDSVIHFYDMGFKNILPVHASGVSWTTDALDEYERQLMRVTEWWLDRCRDREWIHLFFMKKGATGFHYLKGSKWGCGAGRNLVAVDTSGNIWPCHRFANRDPKEPCCLGNIHNGGYTNLAFYSLTQNLDDRMFRRPSCKGCRNVIGCQLGCPYESYLDGPNGMPGVPGGVGGSHICRFVDIYARCYQYAHRTLTSENNGFFHERIERYFKQGEKKGGK